MLGLLLLKAQHILLHVARSVLKQCQVVLDILLAVQLIEHKVERQVGVQPVVGREHFIIIIVFRGRNEGGQLLLDCIIGELLILRKRAAVDLV